MAATIATPLMTTCRREKSAISFVVGFNKSEESRLFDLPYCDTLASLAMLPPVVRRGRTELRTYPNRREARHPEERIRQSNSKWLGAHQRFPLGFATSHSHQNGHKQGLPPP